MSTEEITSRLAPPLTLGQYVAALVSVLGDAHPTMLARMKVIVDDRRAHIILDDEQVEVYFGQAGLELQPRTEENQVSEKGETDSETVLKLLDGYVEVTDAILSGHLRVFGSAENIVRMFMAIEVLLDASPRTPALQSLSSRFRRDKLDPNKSFTPEANRLPWYPFGSSATEIALLEKLDLLPNTTD